MSDDFNEPLPELCRYPAKKTACTGRAARKSRTSASCAAVSGWIAEESFATEKDCRSVAAMSSLLCVTDMMMFLMCLSSHQFDCMWQERRGNEVLPASLAIYSACRLLHASYVIDRHGFPFVASKH